MTEGLKLFSVEHAANQVAAAGFTPKRRLKVNATAIQAVQFAGSGLDDCTSSGTFSGIRSNVYKVTVSLVSTPDEYTWTRDGVEQAADVAMVGGAVSLDNGVQITFAADNGHTLGESWEFEATITTDRHKISGLRQDIAALRLSLDQKVWYQWQVSASEPAAAPIISTAVVATGLVQAQIMPAGKGITLRVPWGLVPKMVKGPHTPQDLYFWVKKHTVDAQMQISEI